MTISRRGLFGLAGAALAIAALPKAVVAAALPAQAPETLMTIAGNPTMMPGVNHVLSFWFKCQGGDWERVEKEVSVADGDVIMTRWTPEGPQVTVEPDTSYDVAVRYAA